MTYWVVQAIKKISKIHTQQGTFDSVSFTKRHRIMMAKIVMKTTMISENGDGFEDSRKEEFIKGLHSTGTGWMRKKKERRSERRLS